MSSDLDRDKRKSRLRTKNSHHSSHRHDGKPKKKMEPYHRHGRVDNAFHHELEEVGVESDFE